MFTINMIVSLVFCCKEFQTIFTRNVFSSHMNVADMMQSVDFIGAVPLANGTEELFGVRILLNKFQDFVTGQILETQGT